MKYLTIAVIVFVAVFGLYWWQKDNVFVGGASSVKIARENSQEDTQVVDNKAKEIAGPKYVEYDSRSFEKMSDKRRVLFFYANWCPICRPADASFKENVERIPDDVVVFRVNFNDPDTDSDEKALARKYGITYQHTFVLVDAQGNQLKLWASGEIDELLENLK